MLCGVRWTDPKVFYAKCRYFCIRVPGLGFQQRTHLRRNTAAANINRKCQCLWLYSFISDGAHTIFVLPRALCVYACERASVSEFVFSYIFFAACHYWTCCCRGWAIIMGNKNSSSSSIDLKCRAPKYTKRVASSSNYRFSSVLYMHVTRSRWPNPLFQARIFRAIRWIIRPETCYIRQLFDVRTD